PDGTLYPCVQFVGDMNFAIGDVIYGIDEKKRAFLFETNGTEKAECASCAIRDRCLHTCGCLNRQVTGRIDRVAPSLCAHERILLPIADKLS
ncbi:MAG: SPASM domain-containing protein, partial [Bacillota bacterium]|nr:SPASM domain-containing protein [Bacillota bacterium]